MSSLPDFQQQQLEFASHIRDPDTHQPPNQIEPRRMAIYRELMFNNVQGMLSSAYPVLCSLYSEQTWRQEIRRFFAEHRCETPYFHRIAMEFLEWLRDERGSAPEDPPFLLELAHYEWLEMELLFSDADRQHRECDPNGQLLTGHPCLSPLARVLAYRFPVHRISATFRPESPAEAPTLLLVYRDRLDEIHFAELNPMTFRLLQLLESQEGSMRGSELAEQIAAESGYAVSDLMPHAATMLEDLRARGVILGTLKAEDE
jgi:hypothetical protein